MQDQNILHPLDIWEMNHRQVHLGVIVNPDNGFHRYLQILDQMKQKQREQDIPTHVEQD